ncbi:MAG: endonuclease MutS2 [Methanosarcinaceae archaeon]|nr:endonuclease MutS2 [Methanosarcinaceae archaeon]
MNNLQDMPHIGEKMTKRFVEHFGSEKAALDAILEGDIASISGVEGIGQRYAISLVHEVRAKVEGVSISDFLKTKEAMEIYGRLIDLIQQFAHTRYAKDKLHIYYPYPETKRDKIEEVRESVSYYMDIAELLNGDSEFLRLLPQIKSLNLKYAFPRVRECAILTADHSEFEYARTRFGDIIDVQLVSNLSEFVDYARGYSHVIASDDNFLGFDFPEDIEPEFVAELKKMEDWKIVPEREIGFFAKNLTSIECAIAVIQRVRSTGIRFFEELEDRDLETLRATLSLIDENGDVKPGADPDIGRLAGILENMDICVSTTLNDANTRLYRCLSESKLILSGQDMLKVMKGNVELKDLLEKEVYQSYRSIIRDAKEQVTGQLRLMKSELVLVESLFPYDITHPVEVDPEGLDSLRQHVKKLLHRKKIEHKRNISKTLHDYHEVVQKMVREVLDFDVGFTIGCFAHEYGLTIPSLIKSNGIGFVGGENLFLRSRNGSVSPIDYSVGANTYAPEEGSGRVVLLSGVNSGGKTSMLELIAQCTILAHMGFPTPTKCLEIGLINGLYYFAKSKGTLDAGAFETTLREFAIVADDSSKMVLVDELESITEPGASARIIAGILEVLCDNTSSMAVFVSHLSELILENTKCSVRVDGIEASGLDSELNLIVDRTPRYNYIAKSTPELIVERLARKTTGKEKVFYERLRGKF